MKNKFRPNFLDQFHDRIVSWIAEGERIVNIAKILSQESNTLVSCSRIVDFCKRHGIDYQSRDPASLVPCARKASYDTGDLCIYCNTKMGDLASHHLTCYRKKYHDYLLPYKSEIIELIEQGMGLNTIPSLLSLDTTRSRIEGFCKRENIDYKGKLNMGLRMQKAFGERGNPSTWDEVKIKKENAAYLRYGVSNVRKSPEIINKIKETKLLRYGKISGLAPNSGRTSKPHKKVSEILLALGIEHFNEHNILSGKDLTYRPVPDIFVPELNLIIEIYGDYWHANPLKYTMTDIFYCFRGKQTAQDIWDFDKQRIEVFTNLGYNVEIVWDSEVSGDKINEILSNYRN